MAARLNASESEMLIHHELAVIAYHRNQLTDAEQHFYRILELGRTFFRANQLTIARFQFAWLRYVQGYQAAYDQLMHETYTLVHQRPAPRLSDLFMIGQVRMWLATGETRRAVQWADSYSIDLRAPPQIIGLFAEVQVIAACATAPTPERVERGLMLADRLINLTIGTVKKHTSSIYAKLGVTSRTQAVLRAQEMRLTV